MGWILIISHGLALPLSAGSSSGSSGKEPAGRTYWSSLTVCYTLSLNLLGLLLLPLLSQIGVPVLEVIGLAGAYHYGDPNVFFVLALGRTALDVVLHIAVIILLAQPQVLQYFKAHADLRSMSVK